MIHLFQEEQSHTLFLKERIRKDLKKIVAYEPGIEKINKKRG